MVECPVEWTSGDITKFRENEWVKLSVPLIKAIHKCKAWSSPIHPMGGNLGCNYVERYFGTVAPSTSPMFTPETIIACCPADFSTPAMAMLSNYKTGNKVARKQVSTSSLKIMYQCCKFPFSGYCNQKGFAPGDR